MNTTIKNDTAASNLPAWLNELLAWRPEGETAGELLERADAYAASQPSYAADLRAAAELADAAQ